MLAGPIYDSKSVVAGTFSFRAAPEIVIAMRAANVKCLCHECRALSE